MDFHLLATLVANEKTSIESSSIHPRRLEWMSEKRTANPIAAPRTTERTVFQSKMEAKKLYASWEGVMGAEGEGEGEVDTRRERAKRRIGVPVV